MTGELRVTPEMLQRPVSEANLGEFAGLLGLLLQASGITHPVYTPFPVHIGFPPNPCHLATQALWMTALADADDRPLWKTIYDNADLLCSRATSGGGHSGGGGAGGGGSP
jgi:hypothetical protein